APDAGTSGPEGRTAAAAWAGRGRSERVAATVATISTATPERTRCEPWLRTTAFRLPSPTSMRVAWEGCFGARPGGVDEFGTERAGRPRDRSPAPSGIGVTGPRLGEARGMRRRRRERRRPSGASGTPFALTHRVGASFPRDNRNVHR